LWAVKARVLAAAVFRAVATRSSESGAPSQVSEIIADVSIGSSEGVLVDRRQLDDAVTLLVTGRLVEPDGNRLTPTVEGGHFWQRISHLKPSGMKKWMQEAVDVYSRGEEIRWSASDQAWSEAEALFESRHRARMEARLEILDGVLKALDHWHFVSSLTGSAADRYAAVAALQGSPFFFSKVQANHIVDMGLSQRTALARLSLAEERDALRAHLGEKASGDARPNSYRLPKAETRPRPASLEQNLDRTLEDLKNLAESYESPPLSHPG